MSVPMIKILQLISEPKISLFLNFKQNSPTEFQIVGALLVNFLGLSKIVFWRLQLVNALVIFVKLHQRFVKRCFTNFSKV